MYEILHISAHMGGGVGKVLSGVCSLAEKQKSHFRHRILLLEQPQKKHFIDLCEKNGVKVDVVLNDEHIQEEMRRSDFVQLEWWHHPKMAELLNNFPEIPMILIIWCHVSGCNYPALPFGFVEKPDQFIFTSEYSLENPHWNKAQIKNIEKKTIVINSSGGFDHLNNIELFHHQGFNIGYIGTLNYSKLDREFVDMYADIRIKEAKFIMVGDTANQEIIERRAKELDVLERFEFVGYVNNVYNELARFDIFAYPLNPKHFGTTENSLLEAMAIGLPVVVFNQSAEKYLVQHMETGLLAKNRQEFIDHIHFLYENPSERKRLGQNAKEYVRDKFSVQRTVDNLHASYAKMINSEKKVYSFKSIFGEYPYEWFLSCLGEDKKLFLESKNSLLDDNFEKKNAIEKKVRNCTPILRENSKSSIYQFSRYFPRDFFLNYWKGLIK